VSNPWTPVTTIRDGLYDRIPLNAAESALMATEAYLRLDRIQQLGFVSRVWPGAKHTRFEHSLGVMHLMRQGMARLRQTGGPVALSDDDLHTAAATGLLHDIGHYPFSHAIEELGPPIIKHEQVGRRIILGDEVSGVLRNIWGVEPRRVADLIDPPGPPGTPQDAVIRGLLSGPLDMDKLDYLPRDARACNVPYGRVDTPRLIDALCLRAVNDAPRVVLDDKGISPLHSLINARQEMFDNVYWHHTNRACMAMLLRAVQEALEVGAVTPDELTTHDDASLIAFLSQPQMPDGTRRLVAALRSRRIHKRAVEVSARAGDLFQRLGALYYRPRDRRAAEITLAEMAAHLIEAEVHDTDVLIDIPKPEKWSSDVWVQFDRPPIGFRPLMPWHEVVGARDDDFRRYEEHRRLIRIVAAGSVRDVLRREWENLVLPLLGGVL
jgi:HD superfamily phosphohydrolase